MGGTEPGSGEFRDVQGVGDLGTLRGKSELAFFLSAFRQAVFLPGFLPLSSPCFVLSSVFSAVMPYPPQVIWFSGV